MQRDALRANRLLYRGPPANFNAAEKRDKYDEDEERARGYCQLQQDRVRAQAVVALQRVISVHQQQRIVRQLI